MPNILLDAIYLPLETYFSPHGLRLRTEAMLASRPPDYNLWSLIYKCPPGSEKARRWWARIFLCLLIAPAFFTLLAVLPMQPPSPVLLVLEATAAAWFAFVIMFLRMGVPKEPNTIAVLAGLAVLIGCTLGISLGAFNSLSGTIDPAGTARIYDTPAGKLANMVILGAGIGAVIRMIAGSAVSRIRWSMLIGLAIIVPLTLGAVFLAAPDAAEHYRGLTLALLVTFSGWWMLPLQLLLSLFIALAVQANPDYVPVLAPYAPFQWDDFLMVPMPGTVTLVTALYRSNPAAYGQAMSRLKQHAFQSALLEKIEDAIA